MDTRDTKSWHGLVVFVLLDDDVDVSEVSGIGWCFDGHPGSEWRQRVGTIVNV